MYSSLRGVYDIGIYLLKPMRRKRPIYSESHDELNVKTACILISMNGCTMQTKIRK